MKTRLFDNWDFYSCYIDKDEFYELVKKWELKIEEEYPNELCKQANWVHYNLIADKSWWTIEVWKSNTRWETDKYEVHYKGGRFPSEIVTTWHVKRIFWWRIRYWWIYAWDINWSETWWSSSMYTKDKNWPRRDMIEKNWFKIKEVERFSDD